MSKELVEKIKSDLEAKGVDLKGPCGAFQITSRVAWAKRSEGFGLLAKGGNNCKGYSTDCVILPDGRHYDCLGDGGGKNTPVWNLVKHEDGTPFLRPDAYRPAIDPEDGSEEPSEPPQEPIGDLLEVERRVERLESETKALKHANAVLGGITEDLYNREGALQKALKEMGALVADLATRLEAQETKKLTLTASGSTNRAWGHAHQVEITLKEA